MGTLAQYLVLPVVWTLSKLFSNPVEFRNEDNFAKIIGKPAIIVSNHISEYDSFLLRLSKYWIKLRVYFMGVTTFNSKGLRLLASLGIITLIYKLFGVFTVTPGLGLEKNLEIPKEILANKHVVFIFPEGSINRNNSLLPFKRGAAVLAISSQSLILPLGFREIRSERRRKTIVSVGEPFMFPLGTDYEVATKQLEKAIGDLCSTE